MLYTVLSVAFPKTEKSEMLLFNLDIIIFAPAVGVPARPCRKRQPCDPRHFT